MKVWNDVVAAFGHDRDRARVYFSSIAERVLPAEREIEFANPRPDEPSLAFFRDLPRARPARRPLPHRRAGPVPQLTLEHPPLPPPDDQGGGQQGEAHDL